MWMDGGGIKNSSGQMQYPGFCLSSWVEGDAIHWLWPSREEHIWLRDVEYYTVYDSSFVFNYFYDKQIGMSMKQLEIQIFISGEMWRNSVWRGAIIWLVCEVIKEKKKKLSSLGLRVKSKQECRADRSLRSSDTRGKSKDVELSLENSQHVHF